MGQQIDTVEIAWGELETGVTFERTIFTLLKNRGVNSAGLLGAAGMDTSLVDLGLAREGTKSSGDSNSISGRLNGHGLSHDGAAVSKDLKLGHGAAAWRRLGASRSRQGPKSGGRGGLEERTHGLGLTENAIHGVENQSAISAIVL